MSPSIKDIVKYFDCYFNLELTTGIAHDVRLCYNLFGFQTVFTNEDRPC